MAGTAEYELLQEMRKDMTRNQRKRLELQNKPRIDPQWWERRSIPDVIGIGSELQEERKELAELDKIHNEWAGSSFTEPNYDRLPAFIDVRYRGRDGIQPTDWQSFAFDDGTVYEGLMRLGIPAIRGYKLYSNGDRYWGNFYEGMRHGHGVYVFNQSKSHYAGEFAYNMQHGCGVFKHDDRIAAGTWRHGSLMLPTAEWRLEALKKARELFPKKYNKLLLPQERVTRKPDYGCSGEQVVKAKNRAYSEYNKAKDFMFKPDSRDGPFAYDSTRYPSEHHPQIFQREHMHRIPGPLGRLYDPPDKEEAMRCAAETYRQFERIREYSREANTTLKKEDFPEFEKKMRRRDVLRKKVSAYEQELLKKLNAADATGKRNYLGFEDEEEVDEEDEEAELDRLIEMRKGKKGRGRSASLTLGVGRATRAVAAVFDAVARRAVRPGSGRALSLARPRQAAARRRSEGLLGVALPPP